MNFLKKNLNGILVCFVIAVPSWLLGKTFPVVGGPVIAILAGMLIAEMAAWYRKQGLTLADALEQLYQRYGYFAENQISIVLKGQEGAARIGRIMDAFRAGKPQSFGRFCVAETIDYLHGYQDIPASNVLRFSMTDGSWFALRPSGTEPKIKVYYTTLGKDLAEAEAEKEKLAEALKPIMA